MTKTNGLNTFENTISQQSPETQAKWQESRNKMETFNKAFEKYMYGMTALATGGVLAFEAPIVFGYQARYAFAKGYISFTSQTILNDGKVNMIGVFTDAYLGFGSSSLIQSAWNAEYNFKTKAFKNEYLGNGISQSKFIFSSSVGFAFGGMGYVLENQLKKINSNDLFNSIISNTIYSLPANGLNKAYEKKSVQ